MKKKKKISCNLDSKHFYNQQNNSDGDSLLSISSSEDGNNYDVTQAQESQVKKLRKKTTLLNINRQLEYQKNPLPLKKNSIQVYERCCCT